MRIVLLTALLAVGSTAAFAEEWSKQWSVSSAPQIHLETGDGSVRVSAGEGGRIEAVVTTKGWRIGPGEVTISERQNGDRVELEVHVPKLHFSSGRREIHVELRLPRDTGTFISTGDGAIEMNGIRGQMEARTGDGAIEATDIDGTLAAHTGDGHIKVTGRVDLVDLETGDGSIEAELGGGSHLNAAWRMHTGDGHVTVRLPQDLPLSLDAHSGDGSISVDMPIAMDSVSKERNQLRGKINGGGETLTIRTGDGEIRIEHT